LKPWSLIWFLICLSVAAFIIATAQMLPNTSILVYNPSDFSSMFSIAVFGSFVAGGTITGIISLITKQYVFASVALLLWVIGIMLNIAGSFVANLPLILGFIIPSELWFISTSLEALVGVILFVFFVEIATQRQIT
jgi:hypothetical protein